jgi:hypothetical protein
MGRWSFSALIYQLSLVPARIEREEYQKGETLKVATLKKGNIHTETLDDVVEFQFCFVFLFSLADKRPANKVSILLVRYQLLKRSSLNLASGAL